MGAQTEMFAYARGRVMAMDSAYDVSAANRERDVVVNASYCGVLPARFIAEQRPRGAIGVDCAVGPAGASVAGLWYLEALNIPAAAADVMGVHLGDGVDLWTYGIISFANRPAIDFDASSARMGDGLSSYRDGIISAANALAIAAGVRVGMPAAEAAALLVRRGAASG